VHGLLSSLQLYLVVTLIKTSFTQLSPPLMGTISPEMSRLDLDLETVLGSTLITIQVHYEIYFNSLPRRLARCLSRKLCLPSLYHGLLSLTPGSRLPLLLGQETAQLPIKYRDLLLREAHMLTSHYKQLRQEQHLHSLFRILLIIIMP
jgi:hypothetical protein